MNKNKDLNYQQVCWFIPQEDENEFCFIAFLDHTFGELTKPLCLNENEHYKLQLQLKKYGHGDSPRDPVISIDSVCERYLRKNFDRFWIV
jgi:hypothetical protein